MPRAFDRSRLDTVHLVPPTPFTPDGKRVLPDVLTAFVRSASLPNVAEVLSTWINSVSIAWPRALQPGWIAVRHSKASLVVPLLPYLAA